MGKMTIHFAAEFKAINLEAKFRIGAEINRSVTLSELQSLTVRSDNHNVNLDNHIVIAKFVSTGLKDNVLRCRSEHGVTEFQLLAIVSDQKMDEIFDLASQVIEGGTSSMFVEFGREGEADKVTENSPVEYIVEYANILLRRDNGEILIQTPVGKSYDIENQ